MTSNTETIRPVLEQILDSMFEAISEHDLFDAITIAKLRRLVETGNLAKVPLVAAAVSEEPEADK